MQEKTFCISAFSAVLFFALFATSCDDGTSASTPSDSGSDGDSDSDTDADADTDSESDTDEDSGTSEISDPGLPGHHGTATETVTFTVSSEDIQCAVFVPEGEGPFPMVVFTHGFMLAPSDYVSYGEHLASWGYITIMPKLPGELINAPTHLELKQLLKGLLDAIEAAVDGSSIGWAAKGDFDKLALSGHSMGGKISFLVATEDSRPVVVFGVDPVDEGGGPFGGDPVDYPSVTPELMNQINVPTVMLGETVNAAGGTFGQACAPEEDNFHQYYLHAVAPALEIEVLGAFHMSFLDDPECGITCSACPQGTDDWETTRMLTRRYMTAFFNVFVLEDDGYYTYLNGARMDQDVQAGYVLKDAKNGF